MTRLLAMIDAREIQAVIVAKLDRLTRSSESLCELLEGFERCGAALISAAESLDTGSAVGRLVTRTMMQGYLNRGRPRSRRRTPRENFELETALLARGQNA